MSSRDTVKVFIGGLSKDTDKDEIERMFAEFHPTQVWIARNPPGFGFVHFADARDADDAVKKCDGLSVDGVPIRVELSHNRPSRRRARSRSPRRFSPRRNGSPPPPRRRDPYDDRRYDYDDRRDRYDDRRRDDRRDPYR